MNNDNKKLQKAVNDSRYTVDLEWSGHSTPKHTIRFCGEFVACEKELTTAILQAIFHKDERETKLI